MTTPIFTYLNHAGFLLRTEHALLLADPWLEGSVLNDAWCLLDDSTSSASLVAELNASGLPVFVWCSGAQPDRLSTPFLRRLRSELRGIAIFVYRRGRDARLADALRRHRCATLACAEGQANVLAPDLTLTAYADGDAAASCLVECGGRHLLALGAQCLNSRAACQSMAERLRREGKRVDLLLSGHADMAWCGNPDEHALRADNALRGVERLALQAAILRPRLLVPAGWQARFSRLDNAWLNRGRCSPQELLDSPCLQEQRAIVRMLAPGAQIDLERDSAANLQDRHELALAYWMACWQVHPAPLPRPPLAQVVALKDAFLKYRVRAGGRLRGLPRLLERLRLIRPLVLNLPDLRQSLALSYLDGLRPAARDAPVDLAMCSGTALYLLRAEDGYDVTVAGGCFWVVRASALSAFGRFFLPQRMARRGWDRQRPWEAVRVLLKGWMGWVARGMRPRWR